ncbi:MAG: S1 RNA-binding domain-containing protein, partial [Burkholderiaceae bacterium]
ATREVDAWLKCEFLKDRIGEEFDGVIAAVTNFGCFVELSDLFIEGLMHVSALPGDYYHFDRAKQRLVGERTRRVFQLGGAVTVKVARVDLDDRKIELELAGMDEVRRSGKTERASRRDARDADARPGNAKKKGRAKPSQKKAAEKAARPKSAAKKAGRSKSASAKKSASAAKRPPGSRKPR